MRAVKIAAWVIGGLVVLVAVALVLVVLLVDPNQHRDTIERMVKEKTGRELTLSGELKLSVFPWIALELGPAQLGDAPGFGNEPFAAIQHARVGVRLLPLLTGRIEVGHVKLEGAQIHLITDAQGRSNWKQFGGEAAAPEQPHAERAPMQLPTIAGLSIVDSTVTVENRQEKTRRAVRDFNLETGRLVSGEPFDLKTDFVLEQREGASLKVGLRGLVTADLERNAHRLAQPEIDLTLYGKGYPKDGTLVQVRAGSLLADVGQEAYELGGLSVATTWKGEGLPAAGVPASLKAQDLKVNLAKQTLALTGLEMQLAGARLTGGFTGEEILDAPLIRGPLKLEPVSLREWLPKLGVQLPKTTDPEVLGRLSFAGVAAVTRTSAEINDVQLQLDDTTMKGSLGVSDFASNALRFNLNIDKINADRYLPPPEEGAKTAKTGKEPPAEIPVEALRKLNARGQVVIGEAIFAKMKFTNLRLGVNARDGRARFYPAEASMYGGNYRGDVGVDATGKAARITLDDHVSDVNFAPLFKDLFDTQRISGKGSANLKLAGSGRNTDELMRTLSGSVDFRVADGALEGADLWYEIQRARALLDKKPAPARQGPARTEFTALAGSGVMKDGVLTNNDLNVAMQYLKVEGKGTVDIPDSTLDYNLIAKVLKIPRQGEGEGTDADQMQDLVDAQIPVKITGSLTDPKVRPDVEGYLKGKVKERVEQERGKAEEKIREKLGDKLKDIFGGQR